jgi:hypothetical protein
VTGIFLTNVTYCFKIINNGNVPLKEFAIVNVDLDYKETLTRLVSPGESFVVAVPRTITRDVRNTAAVTAQPSIAGLGPVKSEDTSSVDKLDFTAGVKIVNKVYVGEYDNGLQCGTAAAVESVEGVFMTSVVYCFSVTNVGNSYLADIVVTNANLSFVKRDGFPRLAPGQSFNISTPGKITTNLQNLAVVIANPVTETGQDLLDLADVRSEDPSEVKKLIVPASVTIQNTVYLGQDSGKRCRSSDAVEEVVDLFGSNVTYCFVVTNTGKAWLQGLRVDDVALQFADTSIKMLAPGNSTTLFAERTIAAKLTNMANVTGSPSLMNGTLILDMSQVSASDPSKVDLKSHAPNVAISNTVYLGNDGGKSCGTGVESVSGQFGKAVTFCFNVTNTGNL